MKSRRVVIYLFLCVAMLLPGIAAAQGLSVFAKQKVVVADVVDRNDRALNPAIKELIRQGFINTLTNSSDFEVYDINIADVKKQLQSEGKPSSFTSICNRIGKNADFIIFTSIKSSSSAFGSQSQSVKILLSSSLYRINTATEVLADQGEAEPTEQSILLVSAQLASRMLGIKNIPQSRPPQTDQQPGYQQQTYQQPGYQQTYSQTPQPYVENANCGLDMKMVYVEGGTFTMGATSEQSGEADSDESPTHSVTLDSYYIGECEVTQAQWQKIMGNNPSSFKGDSRPVEQVSWEDAQNFCRELSAITGKTYLLPTEAQWEYAARGGKHSKGYKYSGSYAIDAVAWYDGNSGNATHPVKQKRANELGLYDMSGNVWEWCSDWYGSYSSSSQNNPTGASSGQYRVLRGGSWYNGARYCRSSDRGFNTPSHRYDSHGFRVVCLP